MAIVGASFPVLMLAPNDEARESFEPFAPIFIDRGARVMLAGATEPGALTLPVFPYLHPVLAPIASIQSFYAHAAELSLARGLHPDRAPHLSNVTARR
jgi:glucosamine--fructose-6-phosphate aminotransferase (isomerizing)